MSTRPFTGPEPGAEPKHDPRIDRLSYAALMLAKDPDAMTALLAGVSVPRHRLQPDVLKAIGEPSKGPQMVLTDVLAVQITAAGPFTRDGEHAPPEQAAVEEPTPPPLAITLAELLDRVAAFVRHYVVMSATQADAIALWCAHTHSIDSFELSPYLALKSPEKRSGKTTALKVLELLVARPWRVVTPSEAVVFRKIDRDQPTLLLDEFDTIWSARDHEPLRAVLNAGNEPGTSVPRCVGANRDQLADFSIFCAKVMAGIGRLPDTVADRTIAVELKRKKAGESAARFRRREAREAAGPLHRTLVVALEPLVDVLAGARPELPDGLDDRALDTWEPLLAIADLAGGDWPERGRRAAVALSGAEAREEDSAGVLLLRDLRAIFDARGVDRLSSASICEELHAIEESPWGDWYGRPITARGVAKVLGRYGIKPKQLWLETGNSRGYERASFEDAWARHLPDPSSETLDPLDPSNHAGSGRFSDALDAAPLADGKGTDNPHEQSDLAVLTDTTPDRGDGVTDGEHETWLATASLEELRAHYGEEAEPQPSLPFQGPEGGRA